MLKNGQEFDYLAEKQNKCPLNQQMVINYTYKHRNANQYVTYPRSEKKTVDNLKCWSRYWDVVALLICTVVLE